METTNSHGWALPLGWLAELDNRPFAGALADAFGDRYLCLHNPIFAAVRRSVLGLDYRFSAGDTPLWRDYQAFGLTTLHQILSTRIIPYFDTAKTVERLLESNPSVRLSASFILGNLKPNYVFHESAHCVACSIFARRESDLRAIAPDDRERFVLEATLAESFANTVETLGSLVKTLPLSDTIFYSLNSYMAPKQKRFIQLERAGAQTGEYLRFALLFLASFEANLAAGGPDDATRERIAVAANCDSSHNSAVHLITDAAFRLSANFREDTTPAYFQLLGYQREYASLIRAGWLGRSKNQQFVREIIPALFDASVDIGEFPDLHNKDSARGMFAR